MDHPLVGCSLHVTRPYAHIPRYPLFAGYLDIFDYIHISLVIQVMCHSESYNDDINDNESW